jgi:uncharacterized repeat protein (TIGR03803 family)
MKRNALQLVILTMLFATFAWAKTREKIIFSFDEANGNVPDAGLIADKQGNLYGTTFDGGGANGLGNVFELSPTKSGGWTETVLHKFTGPDGALPVSSLIFDAAGNLYGTAQVGGQGKCTNTGLGCGVVFKLSRGKNGWKETVLYSFVPGKTKGVIPAGGLVFDSAGNLYGTTWAPGVLGGPLYARAREASRNTFWGCSVPGCGGTVYKLTPTKNGWKETDIYAFTGGSDGSTSQASLIFDGAGNLYGTTVYGGTTGCTSGYGCGVVFKLSPGKSGWKESVLFSFTGAADGAYPMGSLVFDAAGNLYSTAAAGGASEKGAVFELTNAGHKWTEAVLYSFTGGPDGGSPFATVISDGQGNLYGTTAQGGDGYQSGVAYELIPSGGGWTEKVLHTFTYGGGEGQSPVAPLSFGPKGYLYGTTQLGGAYNHGAVFKLVP